MESLGFIVVSEATVAIKEQFGKCVAILGPGLHWVNPCSGCSIRGWLNLRKQQLIVPCQVTTQDNVGVTIVAAVWHQVDPHHAREAFYNLENLNQQLQALVINVICAAARLLTINGIADQTNINDLELAVAEEVRRVMGPHGYMIERILVTDIELDE